MGCNNPKILDKKFINSPIGINDAFSISLNDEEVEQVLEKFDL